MKRLVLTILITVALVSMMGGVAYANFGPHGGYELTTDACAGCHRAHTSFSSVTWTDSADNTHTALLVSNATNMKEFCYACHGDGAPGASTNVEGGVFDGGPSGASGDTKGVSYNGGVLVAYETLSSWNTTLNGGGFVRMGSGGNAVTSLHDMEAGALTDPLWGAGNTAPSGTNLTCTSCHDPHGSTNYRLLNDQLQHSSISGGGLAVVGGYDTSGSPKPYVVSAEVGYPDEGWKRHQAGITQMAGYKPNYTTAQYAYPTTAQRSLWPGKEVSMSGWCAGCHQEYIVRHSPYNYGSWESTAGSSVGMQQRHRHPVNNTLVSSALNITPVTSTVLPLEGNQERVPIGASVDADVRNGNTTNQDIMGCLTCHRAHGTAARMSGFADAFLNYNGGLWRPVMDESTDASDGVNPNWTSALLRDDNRAVCERCHNK